MRRVHTILLTVTALGAALLPGIAGVQSAAAATPCVVTAKTGPNSNCGPYKTSQITLSNGFNTYVANNGWACGPNGSDCGPQKLTAYNPSKWWVSSNQARGNTGVLSYPDVMQLVQLKNGNARPLTSFSRIHSYYAESMPHNAGTDAEAAYDLWLDNTTGSNEVMIWVDNVNRGTGGAKWLTHHTFFNVRYALLQYGGPGGELIWSRHRNSRNGTIHILSMLRWLVRHHYESATTSLSQVDFGWEICSTGGQPETFKVTAYNLRTAHA
ncbi:MAG: hypothetical protein J2P17_19185 [Mycobacterium sp.]|nr:hypothetical protein [Mycobacterium sp.]